MMITIHLATVNDFQSIFFPTMEVIGYRQLSGYYHSSKYLILCSTEDTPTGLKQLEGE